MNLKKLSNALTSKVGRQVLTAQKNSPAILFGAGVAGVIVTAVLASRATLKLEEVLYDSQKDMAKVQACNLPQYTDEDRQRDMTLLYVKGAVNVAKLYAPAIVAGALSVAALTGSHIILNRRNVALTAAYAAIDKGFREYRERVVGEFGADKDREFRYGLQDKEIVKDTKNGPVVKTIKGVASKDVSIYARFFDETSRSWQKEPHYNQFFIQCQQNYANDKLLSSGHLFLNEVYDMLGLERSKAGAVVGWVLGNGDDRVDFGVFRSNEYMGQEFVNGNERSILLDFNVDGVIYDKI